MADICAENPEFDEWLKDRPEIIQEMGKSHPPHKLYLLKTSNHKVFIISYSENRTVTVVVSGKYNLTDFERRVFGIKPEDLEECDLPKEGEPLGVMLNQEQAREYIQSIKEKNNEPNDNNK